jgi:hypothetical protein
LRRDGNVQRAGDLAGVLELARFSHVYKGLISILPLRVRDIESGRRGGSSLKECVPIRILSFEGPDTNALI